MLDIMILYHVLWNTISQERLGGNLITQMLHKRCPLSISGKEQNMFAKGQGHLDQWCKESFTSKSLALKCHFRKIQRYYSVIQNIAYLQAHNVQHGYTL